MGVARVVVTSVELLQVVPGQVGDVLRIATRHVRVGQSWEQRLADRAVDGRAWRGERALHLVEHDALVSEAAVRVGGVLELEADPLLLERVLRQLWEEGRVQVHVEEVLEILRVPCAEQVHRPVGAGERIHEGGERPAGHAEEGISHRESLRAREDDVLQDVGDSGGVGWRRGKENREPVVVVRGLDVDVARPGGLVLQLEVSPVESLEGFAARDRVPADRVYCSRFCFCHVNG